MATAEDNRIEIELAIRDSMSVALKQMAKSLSDTKDKAAESAKQMAVMDSTVGGLAKSLHGPFGAIAGLTGLGVAAGQVILNFAQSRAQLNLFADTSRISTREVTALRNTMELAGVPIKETTGYIASMTGAFRDMWMNKWGSRAAEQAKMYGDVTVESIGRVIEAVKGGNFSDALSQSLEELRKTAPQHRAKMTEFYSQVLGVPAPVLEILLKDYQTALDKIPAMNDAAARKVHEIWTGWMQKVTQTWEGAINSMILLSDQIISNPEKALESAKRGWQKGWGGGKEGEVPLPRSRPMPGQNLGSFLERPWQQGKGDELSFSARAHPSSITQEQIKLSEETNAILIEMRNLMKEGGGGLMGGGGGIGGGQYGGTNAPGGGAGGSVGMGGVSSKLLEGVRAGAELGLPEGYSYKFISGFRPGDRGFHGHGGAADIQIYDEKGNAIPNVGNHPRRGIYDKVALSTQAWFARNYPGYNYTYGGHFNSGVPNDLMHHQEGGVSARHFTPEELQTEIERQNKVDVIGRQRREVERQYGGKLDADAKKSINDRKAGGSASDQQIEAFKRVRAAAVAAGSPLPDLTAAIAMHESGWFGRGGVFEKSGGTNPFGQTGVGPMGSVLGRDMQKHAVYGSLDEGVAAHMARWGSAYADTPEKTLANMVKRGYNTTDPAWTSKIDRALSVGSSSKGTISAEVNFQNIWPGVSTRADTAGEIFEKLKVNNLKQSPRADATTADPYPWAMSN